MAQTTHKFRYTFTLRDGHKIRGVVRAQDRDAAWRAAAGLRAQLVTNMMVVADESPQPNFDEGGDFPPHLGQ